MNKYTRWYNQIIENARSRTIDGYVEKHHIKPRSLGGSDAIDNVVALTAREHFICHWLLIKITAGEDRYKMINALRMMRAEKAGQQRYATKLTSRVYENIKQEYSKLQSERTCGEKNPMWGKTHTDEACKNISQKNTGKKLTKEQIARQVAAQTGRKRAQFSDEWRAKLSKAKKGENNNRYGVVVSEETKRKISERLSGRMQDPEVVARRAEKQRSLNLKREKKLCPHCDNLIAVNGYTRWHGDNCKFNMKDHADNQ
jgi:hypothetical protein